MSAMKLLWFALVFGALASPALAVEIVAHRGESADAPENTLASFRLAWERHDERLGPFRRPRDAMVALEREVVLLRNRHGPDILFGDQLWAET